MSRVPDYLATAKIAVNGKILYHARAMHQFLIDTKHRTAFVISFRYGGSENNRFINGVNFNILADDVKHFFAAIVSLGGWVFGLRVL